MGKVIKLNKIDDEMSPNSTAAFTAFVRSTAFNLALSGTMISVLLDIGGRTVASYSVDMAQWGAAVSPLVKRGLVEVVEGKDHFNRPQVKPTVAGRLVVKLLKHAGYERGL